jgi:tight adherence protein C
MLDSVGPTGPATAGGIAEANARGEPAPIGFLGRQARRLTPAGLIGTLESRIALAGLRATWPIERVLAAKLALGGGGLVFAALMISADPSVLTAVFGLVLVAMGYFIPDFLLYHYAVARQEQIQRELADMLDQITIIVESGLGFEAAIERAARSGDGPLKGELLGMLQDIRLGVPRAQALERLLQRTDSRDLRNFAHAVSQAEHYGIPIAQILRVQSGELRDKRRQRAEEQAMKIPVKLTIPLVLCILPSLFIVLLGPAALRITQSGL